MNYLVSSRIYKPAIKRINKFNGVNIIIVFLL